MKYYIYYMYYISISRLKYYASYGEGRYVSSLSHLATPTLLLPYTKLVVLDCWVQRMKIYLQD